MWFFSATGEPTGGTVYPTLSMMKSGLNISTFMSLMDKLRDDLMSGYFLKKYAL